jgi:uncharacterized SAM-binding protein YcdF (DUF218 family)
LRSEERKKRLRRWLRLLGLSLAIWSLLAWGAARALVVHTELARADALVVLGGSATFMERTQRAAQLYGQGRASKIILTDDGGQSGWSSEQQRNPFFVERAVGELRRMGVPEQAIEVLPETVSSTYEEAMLLRDYAEGRCLHSMLVVTSAYHSRRALWTMRRVFEGSGVEIGLEAVAPGQQTPAPAAWWLRRRGWRMVAGEYLKIAYYWLRYR